MLAHLEAPADIKYRFVVCKVAFGCAVNLSQQLETFIDLAPDGQSVQQFILLALDQLIAYFSVNGDRAQFASHLNRQQQLSAWFDQSSSGRRSRGPDFQLRVC